MILRMLFLFSLLLYWANAYSENKFDVNNHEAFLGARIAPYFGPKILIENNGIIKEWVELDLDLSKNSEIIDYQIRQSSGNDLFNQTIIDQLNKIERFIRPKIVNGEYVPSTFKYRYDICFDSKDDNGDAKCIEGQPKLLKSTVKTEDTQSKKKVLIYFQYEVPKGIFKSSEVTHQEGDFTAIKVEKSRSIGVPYYISYAKKFGFNSLMNKELLSFYEFFEAYYYYINWDDTKFTDENNNFINPETYNEHKPLLDKTQYWTTRPKSARPQFINTEHFFGDYYAELDAIDYIGSITLSSHVEATGLLTNTVIIKSSGIERLDEITLNVLDRYYMTPAYINYKNVADDITFEINFDR